jgi:hypothetical protein
MLTRLVRESSYSLNMSMSNDALLVILWITSELMMSCSKTVSRSSEVVVASDLTYLVLIWLVAIFPDFKVWLEVGKAARFEELAQMAHISRALLESTCNAPWQR